MAYDTYLAELIRQIFSDQRCTVIEKKMMGGLCYMIDDKMYFGIIKSDLMARVGVYAYEELIDGKIHTKFISGLKELLALGNNE